MRVNTLDGHNGFQVEKYCITTNHYNFTQTNEQAQWLVVMEKLCHVTKMYKFWKKCTSCEKWRFCCKKRLFLHWEKLSCKHCLLRKVSNLKLGSNLWIMWRCGSSWWRMRRCGSSWWRMRRGMRCGFSWWILHVERTAHRDPSLLSSVPVSVHKQANAFNSHLRHFFILEVGSCLQGSVRGKGIINTIY